MNEELSRELETIVEMFGEVYDSLNEIFDAVIKELSKKLKEYFNRPSKNDNSAPLSCVATASPVIGKYASYASEFNRGKFIALVLSFHLKILLVIRLQWSGI